MYLKLWYLKVNYLGPEMLFWNISSLGWTLNLRYRELTVFHKKTNSLISIFKNTSQSFGTPSFPPIFSATKTLSARSTPMHLVNKNISILFPSIQLIIHSLTHVDRLTGGLQERIWQNMVSYEYTRRVDKNIYKFINLSRAAFSFCL